MIISVRRYCATADRRAQIEIERPGIRLRIVPSGRATSQLPEGIGLLSCGVLRILSDLHVYDFQTQIRDLHQLEPLLAGVQTLVLNGDSCEMRAGVAMPDVSGLKKFFRERVPEVIFVTGNHDPDISETHELSLSAGRVWVTHGDICYDDLTPWSRQRTDLRRIVRDLRAGAPVVSGEKLEDRIRIAREATRRVGTHIDPADARMRACMLRLWDTFFPPQQVLAMLLAWRELPLAAARLAQAHRPAAQVVVTGHVHFPGVWVRPPGPTVINTGSFFSPLGGHLVDVFEDRVQVRRIRRQRGMFVPGHQVAEIVFAAKARD